MNDSYETVLLSESKAYNATIAVGFTNKLLLWAGSSYSAPNVCLILEWIFLVNETKFMTLRLKSV